MYLQKICIKKYRIIRILIFFDLLFGVSARLVGSSEEFGDKLGIFEEYGEGRIDNEGTYDSTPEGFELGNR
jgi:hypothetical protein